LSTAGSTLDPAVIDPVLERVALLLASHETVIAVYPTASAVRAEAVLSTVRALLDTVAVAAAASRLGPIGMSTLAAVLAQLADTGEVAAGSLVAASAWVESRLLSVAWLPTVTGLDLPGLSMVDHLRSYLPKSAFAVLMSPERRLIRLRGRAAGIELPSLLGLRPVVVVGGAAAPPWVTSGLLPKLNPSAVLSAGPGSEVTAWWGTPRAIEVAATATDVTAWVIELGARYPAGPCRWCGLWVNGSACPFCDFVERMNPTR
jgi:hypothetical protein